MKLFKKVLLAAIVLIFALAIGTYIAMKVVFPPEKIKALINDKGTQALNRKMSIEGVSFRVFPNLAVVVREINVANAPGFSSDPALKVRELGLSVQFLSLLRFSPLINEIKLVEPEMLYEVSAEGRNNLEGLGGRRDTVPEADTAQVLRSPAALQLKRFIIENARVRYRNMQTGQELALERINQSASLDVDENLEKILTKGELIISEVKITDPGSGIKKGNIRISLVHDLLVNLQGEVLDIQDLKLGFQDILVTVGGEVRNFRTQPAHLDLRVKSNDIKLASVLKEVPASLSPEISKLSAKGLARFEAIIKGLADSATGPDIHAVAQIEDGGLSHSAAPAGVEELNSRIVYTGDSLNIPNFTFHMGGNPVVLSASLSDLKKGPNKKVPRLESLKLNAVLDLGKLIPLLAKVGIWQEDLNMDGIIRSDIQASGPLDPQAPQNLSASGEIKLENVAASGPSLPQPIQANGLIQLDNEKIINNLAVKLGQSDLNLAATITDYLVLVVPKMAEGKTTRLKAEIRSEFLDLDALRAKTEEADKPSGPPMTAFPSLPKVKADVTLLLAKTKFMDFNMTGFDAKMGLISDVATVDAKGSLLSGGFQTKLKADLKDTTDAKVDFKFKVDRVEANDFLSGVNHKLPAKGKLFSTLAKTDDAFFGKLSLDMDVKTHGLPQTFASNLSGIINVLLNDGKIVETGLVKGLSDGLAKINSSLGFKELTFDHFALNLQADKGKLLVKDARIRESAVGRIIAQGMIGMDNSLDLSIANHLPKSLSGKILGASGAASSAAAKATGIESLGELSMVPKDEQGRAIIYFLVGGSIARPEYRLDNKRMAGEAGSRAKDILANELKKKQDEAKARLQAEKDKLEEQARSKAGSEKKKLEEKAEQEKRKAAEEAKKKGKKVLKGLGL